MERLPLKEFWDRDSSGAPAGHILKMSMDESLSKKGTFSSPDYSPEEPAGCPRPFGNTDSLSGPSEASALETGAFCPSPPPSVISDCTDQLAGRGDERLKGEARRESQ